MKLSINRWADIVKRVSFYVPVTFYFIIFLTTTFFIYQWLNEPNDNISYYNDIIQLLLRVALGLGCLVLLFSLITTLIPFLHFLYSKKKSGIQFHLEHEIADSTESNLKNIKIHIRPILHPLLGFIRLRLEFEESSCTPKFSMVSPSYKGLFSTSIDGIYHCTLPQIKEYNLEKAIVYFEDIFQFFSLAANVKTRHRLIIPPNQKLLPAITASPMKTENMDMRIDQMRKVEGEYLNYKNFETNDDVRRIVWKLYARNKELIVRIPEVMDPYASHIYLYASFYDAFVNTSNSVIDIPFLNYYKTAVWSVYKHLGEQGLQVKYVTDNTLTHQASQEEAPSVKYLISISKWHQITNLKTFVNSRFASVVIISSLNDADEVKELVSTIGSSVTFIFIKLSEAFKKQHMKDWLQWIFIEKQKGDIEEYKQKWALSAIRNRILENEKTLETIFRTSGKAQMLTNI